MHHSRYGSFDSTRQQGVVSVLTAFLLVLLITVLALVIDTGRLYLEQRNLQKIADMAALDAIARLPRGYCAGRLGLAEQFAAESASLHGFTPNAQKTLVTRCANITSQDGLRNVALNPAGSGLRVDVSHEVPASLIAQGGSLLSDAFSGNVILRADAAAQRNEPIASFSVSNRLLSLDNEKLLGSLLKNVGANVTGLELLGPRGTLNTSITPAGLLEALGIEVSVDNLGVLTPASIASASGLKVSEIISASAELVGNSTLAAQLNALSTNLASSTLANVDLLGDNGLLRLNSGSREGTRAALQTELDLGELLGLAVIAGSGEKALTVPGLNLLGLSLSTGITEPAQLAIGSARTTNHPGVKAHTGQARLYIDIDSDKIAGVSALTRLISTRIHLPLTIDLASAVGELAKINCDTEIPTVDIDITSSLLNACIGEIPGSSLWTSSESCAALTLNTPFVTLLGATLVGPNKVAIDGLKSGPHTFTQMTVGEERSYQPANSLAIGSLLSNINSNLLNLLNNAAPSDNAQIIRQVAIDYLEGTKNSNGRYNPARAATFILNGGTSSSGQIFPKLANTNWTVENYKCSFNLLGICLSSTVSANFSVAFEDMSNTGGLLATGLLPSTRNGYLACGGLLSSLTNFRSYNDCVRDNLNLILQRKPGGLDITIPGSGTDTGNPASCNGVICNLLRIPLNSIGKVLSDLINGGLGLELGRTDVRVESISCGVPTLVQ
ncbi:pilus assembly protein TadG-related protein [Vreelandella zhanjiangensis]|uniref:pilus assembly protein TadG-related protein n=1 Tax=Vreelandella zhanjiangensis TaxID=1121960 RepID=UPI0003711CBB|nr:pilus assembly protein TadG-related protein [Halomonas zhanjiangensis]